jgi:signal transduction histidine kinase
VSVEPCELEGLVDEALSSAGLRPGNNGDLRVNVTRRGIAAEMDRRQMLRVLSNLLVNSREAISGAGTIDLIAEVEPGEDGAGGRLRFEVRDDGPGMSEEFIRTSLFRPFTTTKNGGLGIGLAQCRSIVEAHGGRIRVTSQPGHGTRFEVTLPMSRDGHAEVPRAR